MNDTKDLIIFHIHFRNEKTTKNKKFSFSRKRRKNVETKKCISSEFVCCASAKNGNGKRKLFANRCIQSFAASRTAAARITNMFTRRALAFHEHFVYIVYNAVHLPKFRFPWPIFLRRRFIVFAAGTLAHIYCTHTQCESIRASYASFMQKILFFLSFNFIRMHTFAFVVSIVSFSPWSVCIRFVAFHCTAFDANTHRFRFLFSYFLCSPFRSTSYFIHITHPCSYVIPSGLRNVQAMRAP